MAAARCVGPIGRSMEEPDKSMRLVVSNSLGLGLFKQGMKTHLYEWCVSASNPAGGYNHDMTAETGNGRRRVWSFG